MISLGSYYNFSAKDVEFVSCEKSNLDGFPFSLAVYLKSGKKISVSYADSKDRDNEKNRIVRQIENERRADFDRIHNSLLLLKYAVERIDRRQLKIWRQLKALLGVSVEE